MLRTLFVLAILIPGLAAAATSRFAALLLYLWFALFRPQDWLWVDITDLRLSAILSLLVVVPWSWLLSRPGSDPSRRKRLASEAWPNLTHPLTIGMALFLCVALVAQSRAVDPSMGWAWLGYLWRLLLVSLVAVTLISTRERFSAVVMVIALSIGFHAVKAGVSSVFEGGARYNEGLGGAFIDSNGYALGIVMILAYLVATGQNADRRWLRWAMFCAVAPSVYTVISTFSRAGFLAAVVATVTFAGLQRRRAAALGLVAALGLAAVLAVPIPEGYLDRLETIQTYEEVSEESAMSRLHFWRVAIDMARENPLGVGLRNYDAAYDRYDFLRGRYGTGRSVHSSHFQVLAEIGFAGLAVWIGLFAYAFLVCLRIRSWAQYTQLDAADQRFFFTMANALMVSMVGFLVGGAFIALALNDLTWLTFALVAALDRLSAKAIAGHAPASAYGARSAAGDIQAPRFQGAYKKPGSPAGSGAAR